MLNKEKVVFNVELSSNYIRCLQCFNINTIFCKAMVRRVSKIQKIICEKKRKCSKDFSTGFYNLTGILSPGGPKTFLLPAWTRCQTYEREARGTNSKVSEQHGRRVTKFHFYTKGATLSFEFTSWLTGSFDFVYKVRHSVNKC